MSTKIKPSHKTVPLKKQSKEMFPTWFPSFHTEILSEVRERRAGLWRDKKEPFSLFV
jgi:hypothetical protein